jgi:hypothetical protein
MYSCNEISRFPDRAPFGANAGIRRREHRIAGVVLLLAGAYHVGYVLATRQGRSLIKVMFPTSKDARDAVDNARYLAGLAGEKPKFGQFGYAEKMEYWAVVWGTIKHDLHLYENKQPPLQRHRAKSQ